MNQLYPLLTGYLHWAQPPSLAKVMHPVFAYLIVTPDETSILVDTGNPRSLVGKETCAPWAGLAISMRPEDELASRLLEAGHDVGDIDLLVSTHFDFDHCGNHDLFDRSGVKCIVQQSLLDAARTTDRNDRNLWDRPGIEYIAIEGDTEIAPGITLLKTPGHAPGHQSVLVELRDGVVLLAIDALPTRDTLGDGPFPEFYIEDEKAWRESRSRLLDRVEETGSALLYGHDPGQASLLAEPGEALRLTPALRQSGTPVRSAR